MGQYHIAIFSSYYLIPSIPAEYPDSWPDEFKNIVQTDDRNFTMGTSDLSDLFDSMELSDYKNASLKYQLWGGERILAPPGVPVHIFYGTGLDTTCAMDYTNRRFPDYAPDESKSRYPWASVSAQSLKFIGTQNLKRFYVILKNLKISK